MKTLVMNRNTILSIFVVILLIYGTQSISYGQDEVVIVTQGHAPTVIPGEINTTLRIDFTDILSAGDKKAYQVQLRRKSPQGEWVTVCPLIKLKERKSSSSASLGFSLFFGLFEFGISASASASTSDEKHTIYTDFTDLEPGVTYEVRYRDTNLSECIQDPPSPGPWSAIAEGTTHVVPPPRVEFANADFARMIRELLNLDTEGKHIELLKIPETELAKLAQVTALDLASKNIGNLSDLSLLAPYLTSLSVLYLRDNNISNLTPLAELTSLSTLSLWSNNISDLTPLTHLTSLSILDLTSNNISDLTPLAELTSLSMLGLQDNNISDVTPLAELTSLNRLYLQDNNISDVTPLAELTSLNRLYLQDNNISDITPLAQLTHLEAINVLGNNISNQTALAQLFVEFTDINFATEIREILGLDTGDQHNKILIPKVALPKLTQLTTLDLSSSDISSISDFTFLTQYLTSLTELDLSHNNISDVTPLAKLTSLTELDLAFNNISDVTPLAKLTSLTELDLWYNSISDVTPLAKLTSLTELKLSRNSISDVTPLAKLTSLTRLGLSHNNISDITPLAQLTSLTRLDLSYNNISDITPLAQLSGRTEIYATQNPVNFSGMPSDIELITVSTVQPLTETTVNGSSVTLTLVPNGAAWDTSIDNIRNALTVSGIDGVTVSDVVRVSDKDLKVTLGFTGNLANTETLTFSLEAEAVTGYEGRALTRTIPVSLDLRFAVSSDPPLSVATLNESIVTLSLDGGVFVTSLYDTTYRIREAIEKIRTSIRISGIAGISFGSPNYLSDTAVAIQLTFHGHISTDTMLTFTLDADAIADYFGPTLTAEIPVSATATTDTTITDTTVSILPASAASPAVGEQIEFAINIADGEAVAGYQATVQFDDTALRYVSGKNGDFLPAGAFFVEPKVEGNLVKLNAASLAEESNGNGPLATLTFEVIAVKASTLTLSDVLLTNSAGETFVPKIENAEITESIALKGDVNGDGTVNIADLVLVAGALGKTGQNAADVNGDGQINIADLVLVAGALGTSAAAPSLHPQTVEMLTATEVKQWLSAAQQLDLTDTTSQRGILFLQQLLIALTPKETALLANYPNPFNPETWIPYQLAKDADVMLHIYTVNGTLVRMLTLGHQAAGMYQNRSRAAYWDGKNAFGESVASGVYFYTLTAGDFSATRKMLIRK